MPQALHHPLLKTLISMVIAIAMVGCASYTDQIRDAQREVMRQNPPSAIQIINDLLKVDAAYALPENLDKNNVLLLLERATLLQAVGEYELASRDLMVVDQHLDWLDISAGNAESIARYFYSDDTGRYRAPAYERLLVNILNMFNFLALNNIEGARVEARRFQIMERYFLDEEERALLPTILALGNYFSGVAFEISRDFDTAVRHYARAWHYGLSSQDLANRLIDLFVMTGYSANDITTGENSALTELLSAPKPRRALSYQEYHDKYLRGDTLIVVQTGMVPYKQARRLPMGEALIYAGAASRSQYHLSASQRHQANDLFLHGALKFINFPALVYPHLPRQRTVRVFAENTVLNILNRVDIAHQVEQYWLSISGNIIASAITRAITRAVAAQASRAVVTQAAKSQGNSSAQALGWLAALAVEGTMAAVDTPDTRGWITLPSQIHIVRTQLKDDTTTLRIRINGATFEQDMVISNDKLNFLNLSSFR